MPPTFQSIFEHRERLKAATNATDMTTESVGTNNPTLLCSLLVKLLSVFAAPFGYFETLCSFRPEEYTVYEIGPQIVCYSFDLQESHSNGVTFTQGLLAAKTQRH